MVTIKDIARLSGYSIGTVSRVINHHPDVSEQARKKIEQVVKENNFQPNANAKMLKQQTEQAVTIIVQGTQNTFFGVILEKMQKFLKENGEEVSVMYVDDYADAVASAIQYCSERKPKGLIFLGGNVENFKNRFEEIHVPSVLVSTDARSLPFQNLSSYTTDDVTASREAVKYLIQNGHTHIGIIGGKADDLQGETGHVDYLRLEGCMQEMKEHGISFDVKKDYEPCRFSMKSGYDAAQKLLQKDPDLTAVFAIGDTIAVGVMRAAADAGKKVPDDLSVIGYDGIDYARYSVPRLSTIRQDTDGLAEKSVEDLLFRISYARPAHHEYIPFHVIKGESVKKLN